MALLASPRSAHFLCFLFSFLSWLIGRKEGGLFPHPGRNSTALGVRALDPILDSTSSSMRGLGQVVFLPGLYFA